MTDARTTLARLRAALCRWGGRALGWHHRQVRAHPWLAQVPWGGLVAFAIAAAIARLRGDQDWITLGAFAAVNVFFYSAGRLVEIRHFQKQVDEASRLDAKILLETNRLAMAYQQLHMRHFKMTGEIYGDPRSMPGDPKLYDA